MGENINQRFADLALEDVTANKDELNLLDGAVYTADELNAAIHSAALLAAAPEAAGIEIQVGDKKYISAYNETGSAITAQGEVVTVAYSNDKGTEVNAVVTTAFLVRTAVSLDAVDEHALAWFKIGGEAEAGVEGTTDVAAGNFLEVLNGELAFKRDGDGSARTAESAAVAIDAQAANSVVVVTVRLLPEQHLID